MRKLFTASAATLALLGVATMAAAPAEAQRWGGRGGYGHRGGYGYRGGGAGAAIGAGILGLAVGAAIAAPRYNRGYYGRGYYDQGYTAYAPGYYVAPGYYAAPSYYGAAPGYYAPPPPPPVYYPGY